MVSSKLDTGPICLRCPVDLILLEKVDEEPPRLPPLRGAMVMEMVLMNLSRETDGLAKSLHRREQQWSE